MEDHKPAGMVLSKKWFVSVHKLANVAQVDILGRK